MINYAAAGSMNTNLSGQAIWPTSVAVVAAARFALATPKQGSSSLFDSRQGPSFLWPIRMQLDFLGAFYVVQCMLHVMLQHAAAQASEATKASDL